MQANKAHGTKTCRISPSGAARDLALERACCERVGSWNHWQGSPREAFFRPINQMTVIPSLSEHGPTRHFNSSRAPPASVTIILYNVQ